MNKQRKQFMKDKKNYEKLLETKAKAGMLSLAEKEQYQSMIYSRKRNKFIQREKLIGMITAVGISLTMFIVYNMAPRMMRDNNQGNNSNANTKSVKNINQNSINTKNEIAEKMTACMDLSNRATQYFNEGIQEYNTEQRVGIGHVEQLKALYNPEIMKEYKMINQIFSYKLDKHIDILTQVEDPNVSRQQIQKETEELKKLDKMYWEAIYEVLDKEGIEYERQEDLFTAP